MICKNCGAEIEQGKKFCYRCGAKIEYINIKSNNNRIPENNIPVSSIPANAGTGKPASDTKFAVVISIIVATVALLLAAVAVGYIFYDNAVNNKPQSTTMEKVTERVSENATEKTEHTDTKKKKDKEPEVTEAPGDVVGISTDRVTRYNSSFTYKRMPEIHSSMPASDDTFYAIKDIITTFDMQCEDYMNGNTSSVPPCLMPGTTAYNQQVDYKKNHPNLTQKYTNIKVEDVRYGSDYYYAWVSETIRITENGKTAVSTDHWVYKLQNSGGYCYIVDYTADPSYK